MKSSITQNNHFKYTILSFAIILLIWKILTNYFSPLILPSISSVIDAIGVILTDFQLTKMIGITIVRLLIGLTMGVSIGFIIGLSMGLWKAVKHIVHPIIHLFQTVPPVSWVVLALVWFGFNGKPAIFIVIISTIPIIAINVCEGIINIDRNLLQMAKLYKLSSKKKLIYLIFPSIFPYFNSAFKIVLGSGWKIAVMGEVLTTGDGIGGMIKLARLNLEPEFIIAWSVILVIMFYISDFLFGLLSKGRKKNVKC